MNKKVAIIIIPFLLFFSLISCSDSSTEPVSELTEKPIVIKTSTNYDEDLFNSTFPKNDVLRNVSEAYKNNYSEAIKIEMIEYVTLKLQALGENEVQFLECFGLTNCQNKNSISLPTYIEKAKFLDKDAYIIQLSWGVEPSDLGHYKCFAIGIVNQDTLYYSQCK